LPKPYKDKDNKVSAESLDTWMDNSIEIEEPGHGVGVAYGVAINLK
jgi:hypothetical protein